MELMLLEWSPKSGETKNIGKYCTNYTKMTISVAIVVPGKVAKSLAESLEKLKNKGRIRN